MEKQSHKSEEVIEGLTPTMETTITGNSTLPRSPLDIIPPQDREFALRCADLGEEGIEIFREMNIPKVYVDPEMTQMAKERHEEMIAALRKYSTKERQKIETSEKVHNAKEQLDITPAPEKLTTVAPVDSIDLPDNSEAYTVTGLVEGVHYNTSHGQDAFSINGNETITCVTVCDGISSRAGSGELSSRLAKQITHDALTQNLSAVVSKDSLTTIVESISKELGKIEGGAGSTLVSVRIDREHNTIEWSSIGDSPLIVVDTNENGEILWEILTEDNLITNANYTHPDTLDLLKDPQTHAVGIKKDNIIIPESRVIKSGSITYVKGRKLVVASDFITKVMLHSPEVSNTKAKQWETATVDEDGIPYSENKKQMLSEVWSKHGKKNTEEFAELWVENPATHEKMLNPLSLIGKKPEELRVLLNHWMKENSATSDDVTILAIDLDLYFNQA